MLEKLKDSTFVVFDIETTGLSYKSGNQIIELAAQKIVNGEVVEEFHELINPTVPVEDGAYGVHGLSNLYLSEKGKDAGAVLPKFIKFIDNSVLVGHNILTFDVPFLNNELKRFNIDMVNNLMIDTLVMARKLLPMLPNHKLVTVASHFKIDPSGAHRAMVDVEMNKKVFLIMLNQYLEHLKQEKEKQNNSNANSNSSMF